MRLFQNVLLAFGLLASIFFAKSATFSFSLLSAAYAEDDKGENGVNSSGYGIPSKSLPGYPEVGKEKGVYNGGQAAIWDLNTIDHYRAFGAEERAKGYKPKQPINFSHIVHVQGNKMECQYCHWNVEKSPYAALPSVESCMGCHNLIKGKSEESKKEISKLEKYYQEGRAIPWQKVHVMPDHYKFNHQRHTSAGVSCHSCHGQVAEMPEVQRQSSMKMGFCVECHREQGTSIDCTTCHY